MTVGLLYTAEVCFVFICVFLVLLILIQKGRGGGLASAFGGAGGQTAFGSKTGDVLTWTTSVVFAIFLFLAVVLNLIANNINKTRYGGNSTAAATVPLTPAERSSLPKEPAPEPADKSPQPGTPAAMPTGPAVPMSMTPAPSATPATPAPAPSAVPASTPLPTTLP